MNLALCRVLVTPTGTNKFLNNLHLRSLQSTLNIPNLRLNIILVSLALGRDLDSVPLRDDADVALEVALDPAADVVRVGEEGPLVVELVVWDSRTLT